MDLSTISKPGIHETSGQREQNEREDEAILRQRAEKTAHRLTDEEKDLLRQQMENDAGARDKARITQLDNETKEKSSAVGIEDHGSSNNPKFLASMRTEVYIAAGETSLTDRIKNNRHYQQSSSDASDKFMNK